MRDKYFKCIKYFLILWTVVSIACALFTIIFSSRIANEWMDRYYPEVNQTSNSSHSHNHHNRWKLSVHWTQGNHSAPGNWSAYLAHVNQTGWNSTFEFNLDGLGEALGRGIHKTSLLLFIILCGVFTVLFNTLGCVGITRAIPCLVMTFTIYMIFATIVFIISSFKHKCQWIAAIAYLIVSVLSYCLFRGIRERRYSNRNVGVLVTNSGPCCPDLKPIGQNNNNDYGNNQANLTGIYPTLPQQEIFNATGSAAHTGANPTAPPMPIGIQHNNFSHI